jgi:hypothetical protein
MEGWRKMTLLMVLVVETADDGLYVEEQEEEVEPEDERRKEVRRREGVRRAARV